MTIDGQKVGECAIPKTYKYFMDWEGFSLGENVGSAVSPAFADRGAFAFTGEIDHLKIMLGSDLAGPNDYETMD